ncbi:MAG: hypothetical protein LUH05_04875 [Candidatus Gastranaerophilales bacterium]|nr:hypothetical protein [Candidatus Gastranaerophilales bacterium]
MDYKKLIVAGLVFITVQFLISAHIFVTFSEMAAYAASKDNLVQLVNQLDRIEKKIDKIILGY